MFSALTVATLVWAQSAPQATFHGPSGDHPLSILQKGSETFFSVDDGISPLGGKVTAESGGFRITLSTTTAAMGPDSRFAVVKDDPIDMPQPPAVVDGKVYAPIDFFQRFLRMAGDLEIGWDPASHSMTARTAVREALNA